MNRSGRKLVSFLFLWISLSQSGFCDQIWYVDKSALPGGNGSSTRPFNKVLQGYNKASDGDTIRVRNGDYPEFFTATKRVNFEPFAGAVLIGQVPWISAVASDPVATEGVGVDTGEFTLSRSGGTESPLTILYAISGTAFSNPLVGDYYGLSGSITIPAGQSSAILNVQPRDDFEVENPESVVLTIASSPSYGGAGGSATLTILDNDPGNVHGVFSVPPTVAAYESFGVLTIYVSRVDDSRPWIGGDSTARGGRVGPVSLKYRTRPVSAIPNVDYTERSGVLELQDGDYGGYVEIRIFKDLIEEQSETFAIDFSDPSGGAELLSPSTTIVTILDPLTNDNFANRLPVSGTNIALISRTRDATSEQNEPNHQGWEALQSVWWTWRAPADGWATLTYSRKNRVGLYTGNMLSSLVEVRSVAPVSFPSDTIMFRAARGGDYQIAVDGDDDFFRVDLTLVAAPANDRFEDRIPLSGHSLQVFGSNGAASKEPQSNEPNHADDPGGASVWWSWTAKYSGLTTVSTEGSTFDTLLGVYRGDSLASLKPVAGSDDILPEGETSLGILQSRVEFNASAGSEYQIAVDGKYSNQTRAATNGTIMLGISQKRSTFPALAIYDATELGSITNDNQKAFSASLLITNGGSVASGPLRIRLAAKPGYSFLESSQLPVQGLRPLAIEELGPPSILRPLASREARQVLVSGIIPSPVVWGTNGYGWEAVAVLEESFGISWLMQDAVPVAKGAWPKIDGFEGPGGGVITISSSVGGGDWNPIVLTNVSILGPDLVGEGSATQYRGLAKFNQGPDLPFQATDWKSSHFEIAQGLFKAGPVTQNLPVTITLAYRYAGSESNYSQSVTVTNIASSFAVKPGESPTGPTVEIVGAPGLHYVIEFVEDLSPPISWKRWAVAAPDLSGRWTTNLTITAGARIFLRMREP